MLSMDQTGAVSKLNDSIESEHHTSPYISSDEKSVSDKESVSDESVISSIDVSICTDNFNFGTMVTAIFI